MFTLPDDPIFVSYSRRDAEVMQKIVIFLREQGFKVWVDNERLIPGTPIWEEEIEKAIKAASSVIVIMSPDSKNSEWVRREISLADQYRKHILPILARGDEDTSVTLRLITRQFVDLRQNEELGLRSLNTVLSQHLQGLQTRPDDSGEKTGHASVSASPSPTYHDPIKPAENTISPRSGLMLWMTIGLTIGGLLGGFSYSEFGSPFGGAVGGIIGGLVTSLVSRVNKPPSDRRAVLKITLAWAVGGAIGWFIGDELTEAIGMAIGYAIIASVGWVSLSRFLPFRMDWSSLMWVTVAWAIGGAIGWSIGRYFQESGSIDWTTGWALGSAVGWAIGGYVLSRQLLKNLN